MKAVTYHEYGAPEVLQIRELERPSPSRNEVLVRIHSAMVSFGDCRMRSMELSDIRFFERLTSRLVIGIRRPKRPILGMGLSGEVVSIGSKVREFKVGDSIVAGTWHGLQFGGYAEYISIREGGVIVPKPKSPTYEESVAALGGALCAGLLEEREDSGGPRGVDLRSLGGSWNHCCSAGEALRDQSHWGVQHWQLGTGQIAGCRRCCRLHTRGSYETEEEI